MLLYMYYTVFKVVFKYLGQSYGVCALFGLGVETPLWGQKY